MKLNDSIMFELGSIAAEWNGDEPGIEEERATIALEAIDKLNEVEELLRGL